MREYRTLNQITISTQALLHNYRYYQSINPQAKIAPVLKANAYGHGISDIAKFVDKKLSAPFICVDSLYEAYTLYKQKIVTPILIMGYTDPNNYQIWKKLPFHFGVWDTQALQALNQYQPSAHIHIKLDTGMRRLGLLENQIESFIKVLKTCKNLVIEGIFSHLSQADNPRQTTFTKNQVQLFKKMVAQFERAGYSFAYKHISATAGATTIHDPYFNLIRLGLGLYGYSPFSPHSKEGRFTRDNLLPALTLTSRIAQIKEINIGDRIGYGGTYVAKQKERIAILPIGYHDGLNRGLSNIASFELNKIQCPSVGNICMNMATVKIPRTTTAQVGDYITIISGNPSSTCSIYKLANQLGTIPYTILVGLHTDTRRILT